MGWYGDPDELDRLAGGISASAERARDHAQALWSRCLRVEWQSAAADRFRETVERDAAALRRAADQLDEAAHRLRQLAEHLRERIAQIRAIEQAVTGWFGDQARQLERAAVNALTDPVGAARRVAQDPPWRHWPWTPSNLPPPGDKRWLEVGEFLRRRGVVP